MPLHQIYGRLTGFTRIRKGWRGRLVVQVETREGGWKDATERELRAIGFSASSERGRRVAERAGHPLPPLDWTLDDLKGMKWR